MKSFLRCATPLTVAAVVTFSLLSHAVADDAPAGKWKPLFDGKSLDGWKVTPFGGEGEVTVADGVLELGYGASMTGITYQGKFPQTNYELHVVAQRADGNDFFAALTFPVGDTYCSFVPGGWGGATVGLSSIDDNDASQNDTTQYISFKTGQWYDILIRVTSEAIQVKLDGKQIINQPLAGKKISTRVEVDLSKPLGIATWETRGLLKTVEYRSLK